MIFFANDFLEENLNTCFESKGVLCDDSSQVFQIDNTMADFFLICPSDFKKKIVRPTLTYLVIGGE